MKQKKTTLTLANIRSDIIHRLKNPPDITETSYEKWTVPSIIIAVVALVVAYFFIELIALIVTLLLAAIILFAAANLFIVHFKAKKVSLEDYEITTETVDAVLEEHFTVEKGGRRFRRSKPIDNYVIRFENGKTWQMSNDNYTWSNERPMSDSSIYHSTHRGDLFLVVTKKGTGDIIVAYNTNLFDFIEK